MMPASHTVCHPLSSKSSLFTKLPRELRRQIDQAVIDRDPPAYKDVFATFNLAQFGVSFTAFYMYARRLRYQAALIDCAATAAPSEEVITDMAVRLLGTHMLKVMMDKE